MALTKKEALKKLEESGVTRETIYDSLGQLATRAHSHTYKELIGTLVGMVKEEDLEALVTDILLETKARQKLLDTFEKKWKDQYDQVTLDSQCYSQKGLCGYTFAGEQPVDFLILTKEESVELIRKTSERLTEFHNEHPEGAYYI